MKDLVNLQRNIYDPHRDGVTQSLLGMYRSCPTKARLYLNGYHSLYNTRAITFGSIFHACLELSYSLLRQDKKMDVMPEIEKLLLDQYNKIVKSGEPIQSANIFASCSKIIKIMLPGYLKHYEADLEMFDVVELEEVFKLPVKTSEGVIPFIGKKDAVFYSPKTDKLYLKETKTKARYDIAKISLQLKADLQCKVYCLELEAKYGQTPEGIIYDIIKTPDEKKTHPDVLKQEMSIRPGFYFERIVHPITPVEMETSLLSFKEELADFVRWWNKDPSIDYQYSHSCISQYGACSAIEFCGSGKKFIGGFNVKDSLFQELTGSF